MQYAALYCQFIIDLVEVEWRKIILAGAILEARVSILSKIQ